MVGEQDRLGLQRTTPASSKPRAGVPDLNWTDAGDRCTQQRSGDTWMRPFGECCLRLQAQGTLGSEGKVGDEIQEWLAKQKKVYLMSSQ